MHRFNTWRGQKVRITEQSDPRQFHEFRDLMGWEANPIGAQLVAFIVYPDGAFMEETKEDGVEKTLYDGGTGGIEGNYIGLTLDRSDYQASTKEEIKQLEGRLFRWLMWEAGDFTGRPSFKLAHIAETIWDKEIPEMVRQFIENGFNPDDASRYFSSFFETNFKRAEIDDVRSMLLVRYAGWHKDTFDEEYDWTSNH